MTASSSAKPRSRGKKVHGSISTNTSPPRASVFPGSVFRGSVFNDRQVLLLCLALIAATLAFYSPVVHNPFLDYDDKEYITENDP